MNHKKHGIKIRFSKNINKLLTELAKKEQRSVAGVVRELAVEALALWEDITLSRLAEKLDKKGVHLFPHDEVWKR